MNHQYLAATISKYRKQSGLSLRQFSEYSGISSSLISQLENGKGNPSLSVLELLAKALNVPLFTLFINNIDTDSLISHKKDRKKIYRRNAAHVVQDILTPDFMKAHIKLLMMDLKAHAATTDTYYEHKEKEEIAVVMERTVSVELEGKEYPLKKGDVVRIPSHTRHRFINHTDHVAHVLFVLTPELF